MAFLAVDDDGLAAPVGQEMRQRLLRIDGRALLVEGRDLQIDAEPHRARIRRKFAGQHLQERRLAGAVRPDHADPVAALDAGRKILHHGQLAEALGDRLRLDHQLAGFGGVAGRHGRDALRAAMAAELLAHRLQLAEPPHVALAPGGHAVAQPMFLAHDLAAELVLLALLFFEDRVAPFLEMRKTLVQTPRLAAVEPDRRPADPFEEAAVVRDDDKSGRRPAELVFQPFDHRQIEMVGGLVEQQDVRFGRHDTGERCPARLAAGQFVRLFVAGQAEMVEQIGRAVRIVGRSEPGLDIGADGRETVHIRHLRQIAHGGGRDGGKPCRPAARSGRRRSSSSVDLPEPLRPTRAMRSPDETESSAPSSSGVPPKVSTMPSSVRSGGAILPARNYRPDRDGQAAGRGRRRSRCGGRRAPRWKGSATCRTEPRRCRAAISRPSRTRRTDARSRGC